MKLICQKCKATILPENINIGTDLAKCINCNNIAKASDLVSVLTETPVTETPPPGSKLEVHKGFGDDIEISHPKTGLTGNKIPMLVFSFIWLGFIAFWTTGAAQASIIFAAFSAPFWLVGFSMLYGIIKSSTTAQKLTFNRQELSIDKTSLLGTKTFTCGINEILAINLSKSLTKNPLMAFSQIGNTKGNNINLPNLVSHEKTMLFFETASKDDQEWLVKLLNQKLDALKR